MAGLREMKKHLKSIRSIGQLAGAMRTVATAKYSRLNRLSADYAPYAEACGAVLEQFGSGSIAPQGDNVSRRRCIAVLASNRGLCGSYNSELLSRFFELLRDEADPIIIPCGKMAVQRCRDKGISVRKEFIFSDTPTYSDAQELSQYLRELYSSGEAGEIIIVYQKFKNILIQTPTAETFLPAGSTSDVDEDEDQNLYHPDKASAVAGVIPICLDARIYSLLLNCAAGAQAATVIAMRSAYDNSVTSASELETKLNRLRQSQVTSDVMEIAYEREE